MMNTGYSFALRCVILVLLWEHSWDASAQVVQFQIITNQKWADTGVEVIGGHRCRFRVVDMSTVYDWFIPVRDLDGWPWAWARIAASPVSVFRRRPFDPWFALIATVDRASPSCVRRGVDWCAPASGKLVCYFNDAPWSYGNNYGVARLQITEIHAQDVAVSRRPK